MILIEINNAMQRFEKACKYNSEESIIIGKALLKYINELLSTSKDTYKLIDGQYVKKNTEE